ARRHVLRVDMSRSNFCQTAVKSLQLWGRRHLSGLPRFQHPSWSGLEQAGALHEAQNVVLLNEKIEINEAVPAILQVIEVDPEPSASPSIEDIESSGFRIALN